ncbi:unnamed protein product [Lampetra planeri]
MLTCPKQPAKDSSGEEDDGDFIPPTAPGMATPESLAEASAPAEQHCAAQAADSSLANACQMASARLVELLDAAAELVAKLDSGELSPEKIIPAPHGIDIVAATVQACNSPTTPPDRAPSILDRVARGPPFWRECAVERPPFPPTRQALRGTFQRCIASSHLSANSQLPAGIGRRSNVVSPQAAYSKGGQRKTL